MYTVHVLLLIGFGLVVGFISAIPIGAVQLEVMKKAINGHLKPAILVAFGSVTSDFIYGVLILFGFGFFLHYPKVQILTYSLGIIVIIALLYRSYREYKHIPPRINTHITYDKKTSYLTGFTIAITNPSIVVWWVISYKLLLDLSLFETMTIPLKAAFLIACCSGLAGYLILIALIMNRWQESISTRVLDRMNVAIMVLLVFVVIYFSVNLYGFITNTTTAQISII